MSKRHHLFCTLVLGMVLLFSVGCSFFDTEETRTIQTIYSRRSADDTGLEIVIEYTDGSPMSTFFLPDPEAGKEGNGIRTVEAVTGEDGSVTVTVEYTDVAMPPYVFTVPSGRYITDISSETDPETKVVTVTIRYSDGSEPAVLTVYPGRDGIDGDTMSRIEAVETEEGVELHFYCNRWNEELGDYAEEELPDAVLIPKGRGIEEIEFVDDEATTDSFRLRILYEGGGYDEVDIPRANCWHVGSGDPGGSSYRVGDFYFDRRNYRIYQKVELFEWECIADLSALVTLTQEHTVTFHFPTEAPSADGSFSAACRVKHGTTFAADEALSFPSGMDLEGYRFLGWYTEETELGEMPSPNSGHFTDLTPVLSDLDLYPCWEKVS